MKPTRPKRLRINQRIVRDLVDAYTHARLDTCAVASDAQDAMDLYLHTWVLAPLHRALEAIGEPIPAKVTPYRKRKPPELP